MGNTHIRKRYIVFASIAVFILLIILLLEIFMFGRIIPGPREDGLIINKTNAVSDNKNSLPSGYYFTTWPSEHADLIRSHAVLSGGIPKGFDPSGISTETAELYMPTWGYTRNPDEIFVIGGSPQLMTTFTEAIKRGKNISRLESIKNNVQDMMITDAAYAAKINTKTMGKTVLKLDRGHTVNYTGGLLIHRNGYVYAVSQSVLYKIDPEKMEIVESADLPKVGNFLTNYWTTYNGLQVLENGELVLKGFHLINNAELDGYLLLVDPDTLKIDIEQRANVSSARLMIDGNYLYHVNAEKSLRFKITDNGFILDDGFTSKYRNSDDNSTQASSPMLLPNIGVEVFADNTAPNAKTPIKLYTKSIKDESLPMQSANAFTTNKPGFNFFMVAGDTFVNDVVVYYDPLNDLVSANKISADGSIELLWEKSGIKVSASPAISVSSGHIYVDDYKNGRDYFVVLDLLTGGELGRIGLPAILPTVGTIFIGQNNDVYILSSEAGNKTGYVTKVFIK